MPSDHRITHSIIYEHTRRLAANDKSKSTLNRKKNQPAAVSESRLKEFNRSRRLLLIDALKLWPMVKPMPDDLKE